MGVSASIPHQHPPGGRGPCASGAAPSPAVPTAEPSGAVPAAYTWLPKSHVLVPAKRSGGRCAELTEIHSASILSIIALPAASPVLGSIDWLLQNRVHSSYSNGVQPIGSILQVYDPTLPCQVVGRPYFSICEIVESPIVLGDCRQDLLSGHSEAKIIRQR